MSRRQARKSRRPMAGSVIDPIAMGGTMPPGVDFGDEGTAGNSSFPVPGSTAAITTRSQQHHPAMQSHHSEHMFTATGQIMTAAQRSEYCHRRGLCEGCGIRTHDIHGLGLVVSRPVTNEGVYNGICKRCHPRKVRTAMERDGVELEADDTHMLVLAAATSSFSAAAIAEEAAATTQSNSLADELLNIDYVHRPSTAAGGGDGSSGIQRDSGSSSAVDSQTCSSAEHQSRKKSSRVSFLSSATSSGGRLRASFLSNDSSTGDGVDADGDDNGDADDIHSDSEGQPTRSEALQNSKSGGGSRRKFAKKLWKKAKHISMMAIPAGTSSKSLATDSSKSLGLEEVLDDASRNDPSPNESGIVDEEEEAVEEADASEKIVEPSSVEAGAIKQVLPEISTEKEALQALLDHANDANIVLHAMHELTRLVDESKRFNTNEKSDFDLDTNQETEGRASSEIVLGSDSKDEDISNMKEAECSASDEIDLLETLSLVLQRHIDHEGIIEIAAEVYEAETKKYTNNGDKCEENSSAFWQSTHYKTITEILLDAGSVSVVQTTLISAVSVLDYLYSSIDSDKDIMNNFVKFLGSVNMWKSCTKLLWSENAPIRVKVFSFSLLLTLDNEDNPIDANLELLVIASNLLRTYPGSAALQSMVLPYLANALPESKAMIAEGAGQKKVIQALAIHGNDDEKLRQAALAIILELSATSSFWVNDPDLIRKAVNAVLCLPEADTSSLQCDVLANLFILPNLQNIEDLKARELISKILVLLDDPSLLPSLCRLLKSFCASMPSHSIEMAQAGAIGKLAAVAFAADGTNESKSLALDALCWLTVSIDDGIYSLVDKAFTEGLLRLLQQNDVDENGKLCALQITNHLLLAGCHVPHGDILSAICFMIQNIYQSKLLYENSCRIISNISVAAAKADFYISPIEPFCVLLDLIQRDSTTASLQKEACSVIYALMSNSEDEIEAELLQPVSFCLFGSILEENKAALDSDSIEICEGGLRIIDLIAERMMKGSHELSFSPDQIETLVSLAFAAFEFDVSCECLIVYIMGIFQSLSSRENTKEMLVEGGCIVTVIDALHIFSEHIDMQIVGIGILARLCDNSLQVQFACIESDGIEAILSGMAQFQTNGGIQASACRALAHLTIDEDARERMSSAGGLGIIAKAKEIFLENGDLQRDATHLLKWLME